MINEFSVRKVPLACLGGRGPVVWLRALASARSPIQRMPTQTKLANIGSTVDMGRTFITPERRERRPERRPGFLNEKIV